MHVEAAEESPCRPCRCCWRPIPDLNASAPLSVDDAAPPVLYMKARDLVEFYWGGYWPFHGRAHRPSERDGAAMHSAMPLLIVTLTVVVLITALGIRRLVRHSTLCLATPTNASR